MATNLWILNIELRLPVGGMEGQGEKEGMNELEVILQ